MTIFNSSFFVTTNLKYNPPCSTIIIKESLLLLDGGTNPLEDPSIFIPRYYSREKKKKKYGRPSLSREYLSAQKVVPPSGPVYTLFPFALRLFLLPLPLPPTCLVKVRVSKSVYLSLYLQIQSMFCFSLIDFDI